MTDSVNQQTLSIDRIKDYAQQIEQAEKKIHGRSWIPCMGKERKALNTIYEKVDLIQKELHTISEDSSLTGTDKQALLESAQFLTDRVKHVLDDNNKAVKIAKATMSGWQKIGEAFTYIFKAIFGTFATDLTLDTREVDQKVEKIAQAIIPDKPFSFSDLPQLCTNNLKTDISSIASDEVLSHKIEGCWKVRYTGLKDYISSFVFNTLPYEIDQVVTKNNSCTTVTYAVENKGGFLKLIPKEGGESKEIAEKDFYKEFQLTKKLDEEVSIIKKIQANLGFVGLSPEESKQFEAMKKRVLDEAKSMTERVSKTSSHWLLPGRLKDAQNGIKRAVDTAKNTQQLSLNLRYFQKKVNERLDGTLAKVIFGAQLCDNIRTEIGKLIDDIFPKDKFPPYDKSLSEAENYTPLEKRKVKK